MLPETVRVKLSSEAAGAIALTPVVVREMPVAELLEHIVGAAGMDAARVRDALKRGTLVSGASRFRWIGWECQPGEVEEALRALPQPEPGRPFAAARCLRVVMTGPGARVEIAREAAEGKRLFRRRSFWQCLLEMAAVAAPAYVTYVYKERADHYRLELNGEILDRVKQDAGLLKYDVLARQVRAGRFERMELIVPR